MQVFFSKTSKTIGGHFKYAYQGNPAINPSITRNITENRTKLAEFNSSLCTKTISHKK